MLTEAKKMVCLVGNYFKLNLSAVLEYRISFMMQFFGMILNNASFAVFWWFLFERIPHIKGYGFQDVMILWALSSTSFGLCFIFFGNVRNLNEIIMKGELDTYLLQPKEVLIHVLISKTVISAWGDVAYGIVLFGLIGGLDLRLWLIFILSCLTGCLIYTAVIVIVNSLAFWFGNVAMLSQVVFESLITLTLYPEQIYSGFSKVLIYTIVPAVYVTMIPRNLMIEMNLYSVGLVFLAALFFVALSFILFYRGLKHYESGNLFNNKL